MPVVPKPVKKGFFSRFRRAKKTEQSEVVVVPPVPEAPVVPAIAVQSVQEPAVMQEHVQQMPEVSVTARPSGTIDLTSSQVTNPVKRNAGHVINLKDGA